MKIYFEGHWYNIEINSITEGAITYEELTISCVDPVASSELDDR
jgi:hypothetical protein